MITERQSCFQFKASFSPCTILQMTRYDLDALTLQLGDAIARAPNFFLGSPVVIDLEKIKNSTEIDFNKLKNILIKAGLVPIGARGGAEEQHQAAVTAGLPTVTIGKLTQEQTKRKKESDTPSETKLVTQPIRSGMQVYAKNGDLIIMSSVSAGAELLSNGHIHVYGPLRGRALAGIAGNTQARIFCRTLEAELISIAGYYLTKEDMQTVVVKGDMIQIYLDNEQLKIAAI